MKKLLLLATSVFLSGCAGDSDVERVGKLLVGTLTESGDKLTRERVATVPYASMGLSLGANPELLLVLGMVTGIEQDWFAGESIFLAMRQGHIVRTAGLPYDLGGLRPATATATPTGSTEPVLQLVDFPDLGFFGAAMQCTARSAGDDTVEILGAKIPTRHVVEHCEVGVMRWRFDNDFWLDPQTGAMWRSRQYVHPKSPPVILEVLRPAQ